MAPTPGSQKAKFIAIVIGALVAGVGITGYNFLPEFNSAGKQSPTVVTAGRSPLYVNISASGSSSIKYPAGCVDNPLPKLKPSLGSGILLLTTYQAGNSPNAVGGDIAFVKNCSDAGGSGTSMIIDNFCTGSGCTSQTVATTSPVVWNGADKIKVTFRNNPGAGYTGRVYFEYMNLFGE